MKKNSTKLSQKDQEWIIANKKTYSVRAMGRHLGCSHSTIQRFIRVHLENGQRRKYGSITTRNDKHARMTRFAMEKGYENVSEAFIAEGRSNFIRQFNQQDPLS